MTANRASGTASAPDTADARAARPGSSTDLAATLQGIAAAARSALGADRASCYVMDVEAERVSAVHSTETDPARRAFLERSVGGDVVRLPVLGLQLDEPDLVLAIEDMGADPRIPAALAAGLGCGALIAVRLEHPSVDAGGPLPMLGTICCSYDAPRRFSAADRDAARGLATLAALTLANARLQQETAASLAAASAASEAAERQRDYTEALLASMRDGLTVLSPAGVLVEVSPSFCRMTGFAPDELLGRGYPFPYWPEGDPERLARGFARIRETGSAEWDLEFCRRDGERFPVILGGSLLTGPDGEVRGYLGTVKDVTERTIAERELRRGAAVNRGLAAEQAALRRLATRVAAEADPEAVFAHAAHEAAALLGAGAAIVARFTVPGAMMAGGWGPELPPVGEILPADDAGALAQVSASGRAARVDDHDASADDTTLPERFHSGVAAPIHVGGSLWGGLMVSSAPGAPIPGEAELLLELFAELMALAIGNADARSRLTAQAANDPLTGLANHRTFFERLHAEVMRAQRHHHPLSLSVMDLDHFKDVNDEHGHPAGDRVLTDVADRLRLTMRAGDTLARIGGEEFAMLLPETGVHAAWAVAERARLAIAGADFPAAGRLTISAGVAELGDGGSANELVRAADAALYAAKAQGRNTSIPYSPEHEKAAAARPAHASSRVAPSVERLLALGREGVGLSLAAIGEFTPGRHAVRYLDGNGDLFGLHVGDAVALDQSYCTRVAEGRLPNLIRDAARDERVRDLPVTSAAGIGAYAGVPIPLPAGGFYGFLFCLSPRPEPALGERDVQLLQIVAGMLGEELHRTTIVARAHRRTRPRVERALDGAGLRVVLQPIVELGSGRVVAAEALSRFNEEPRRPPEAWHAEAATVGLGVRLELAAVRAALARVDDLPRGVRLALNVSPAALLGPELAKMLSAIPGDRLALELTEHAPVEDYAALAYAVGGLRARGAHLMIDDAGAGFASMRHVLGLHPDAIKLDLSLTRDIDSDPVRRALAASLVAFAREIGADVVAEGIETRSELDTLLVLGVGFGQGYFLARPGPGPVPSHVEVDRAEAADGAPLSPAAQSTTGE